MKRDTVYSDSKSISQSGVDLTAKSGQRDRHGKEDPSLVNAMLELLREPKTR